MMDIIAKVRLTLLNGKVEVRRVKVVSKEYEDLRKEITDAFSLDNAHFSTFWKDSEGDFIRFSTDRELEDALSFASDTKIIHVEVKLAKSKEKSKEGTDKTSGFFPFAFLAPLDSSRGFFNQNGTHDFSCHSFPEFTKDIFNEKWNTCHAQRAECSGKTNGRKDSNERNASSHSSPCGSFMKQPFDKLVEEITSSGGVENVLNQAGLWISSLSQSCPMCHYCKQQCPSVCKPCVQPLCTEYRCDGTICGRSCASRWANGAQNGCGENGKTDRQQTETSADTRKESTEACGHTSADSSAKHSEMHDASGVSDKVNESLTKMKEMGFDDKDSWLTSLLSQKGGDIAETLSAIAQRAQTTAA